MSDEQGHGIDLTNCDREPIHIPGAIQPHGVLLALHEPALRIAQVSANLPETLGVPVEDALGRRLAGFLDADSQAALHRAVEAARLEERSPLRLTVSGTAFDGVLHHHQGMAILELEPRASRPQPERTHHPLRRALVHVQAAETFPALLQTVVDEVQRLTGFERVMVYRFDEEGHGRVEAEVVAEGLDPYLGLHYPASDIPRQARELYLRNWIRTIPDARYTPIALVPELRPDTGEPLDLSLSVLRSVSPIHLEYLANMGIRAAMSISLVVRERLWGLISCASHGGPHHLSQEVQSDCEVLGRLASLQISAAQDREVASRRTARQGTMGRVADAMRSTGERWCFVRVHPPGRHGRACAGGTSDRPPMNGSAGAVTLRPRRAPHVLRQTADSFRGFGVSGVRTGARTRSARCSGCGARSAETTQQSGMESDLLSALA